MNDTTAAKMARQIQANVEAFYSGAVSYAMFHAEQIRLWDAIAAAGATRGVSSIPRNAKR